MRIKQLDVLRAVAVLLVLCHHKFINKYVSGVGWIGVDLFFVLSGFLVAGLLFSEFQKHGDANIGRFLFRRAMKIYPAFWGLIFGTIAIGKLTHTPFYGAGGPDFPFQRLGAELFFIQNYTPGLWTHTWSLAVEEHFYLLLALGFYLLLKHGKRPDPFAILPRVMMFAGLSILCIRLLNFLLSDPQAMLDTYRTQMPTHLRLDSLLAGVLIAYYYHFHRVSFDSFVSRHRRLLFCVVIGLLALGLPIAMDISFSRTFGYSIFYLAFGGLLILSLDFRPERLPSSVRYSVDALAYMGRYSYSIYLWHMIYIYWGDDWLQRYRIVLDYRIEFFIFVVLSIITGITMSKLVEQPCLRLRDLISKGRWSLKGKSESEALLTPIAIPAETQS